MYSVINKQLNIPKYPKYIIDTLKDNGFRAYIVGGCVRDQILGKRPDDYDITTNAKPEDVKRIFKKTIDTGIKHGTVTVIFYEDKKSFKYEVTTFRIDGEYKDGRHPENVVWTDTLKEDLLRRDFTINAMAYNENEGLIDEFGGIQDLENKMIRAVGIAENRFTEDALRMLRAVRFAAKLNFTVEDKTKEAILKLNSNLRLVSKERVQVELIKTMQADDKSYVNLIFEYGLAPYICDGFEKINVGKFLDTKEVSLLYACLLYNTELDLCKSILKQLKLDNKNYNNILKFIEAKKYISELNENDDKNNTIIIKKMINFLGYDLIYMFFELIMANEVGVLDIDFLKHLKDMAKAFEENNVPIFIKDLKVDGNDLMKEGLSGQEIGRALNGLLLKVYVDERLNVKDMLLKLLKKV